MKIPRCGLPGSFDSGRKGKKTNPVENIKKFFYNRNQIIRRELRHV
jgi:hypothetical protein